MVFPATYRATDGTSQRSPYSGLRTKEFDEVTLPPRQRIVAKPAEIRDIPLLLRHAEAAIGLSLASVETVARIACAHPDSLWSFWCRDRLVGGFAMLMLNGQGLVALLSDSIDLSDPAPTLLASPQERPAGIYVWAVLGPAIAAEGVTRVIVRLQQYPYERSDVFALPATSAGLRLIRGLGLHLVPGHPRALYRYVRFANRTQSAVKWESEEDVHECFSA